MFISLSARYVGYACAITQSKINYLEKRETHFFDWLICSLKSVNEVLEGKPIEFEDDYIYPNNLDTVSINFKNFDLLTSHHDIYKFNENSILEITEKYNRRRLRLLETIKCEKLIKFIRYCKNNKDIEELQIDKFYENITSINPVLEFYFLLASDNKDIVITETLLSKKNFKYINLLDHMDEDATMEQNDYFKIIKSYKCIYLYF
jgi:hypothetical protein